MNCIRCKSKNVIKKGKRKTSYKTKQIYYCKNCKKYFTCKGFLNKKYPANVIIKALYYYNQGYSLEKTSKLVNLRFKVKTSKSSIQRWLVEFSDICSFKKIRKKVFKDFKKGKVVFVKIFKHSGLDYVFRYHLGKLGFYAAIYPGLVSYIKRFEEDCPDEMFEGGLRCSYIKFQIDLNMSSHKNQACSLAELALKDFKNNRKRHELVEEFMLINDSATVACEVPVWFWDKKLNVGISGHIDILQIRKDKIYVLDYKPDADKQNAHKVASQLYLYARGLSFRSNVALKMFRCGWFDDRIYYEFDPSEVKTQFKFFKTKKS